MSTRHLVDAELLPLLDALPTLSLDDALLARLRAGGPRLPPPPIPENAVAKRVVSVPGPAGAPDVSLTLYTPPVKGPFGCILHMHGGGYVMGDAASYEAVHRPLAETLGCVIASVDYRLAPETRFPGAIEDCYAALAWLYAEAGALGVDPDRIGVMGESAGGGLAASLALLARDRGEHRIAFQHLVYPMIDDRTGTANEPNAYAGEFIWTPHNNRFGWGALLGRSPGGDDVSPYAAAARADDLTGLPPCFLLTATMDLFVDENLIYAARLVRAGVPTELHALPGAFHAFDAHPTAAIAVRARALRVDALRRALAPR